MKEFQKQYEEALFLAKQAAAVCVMEYKYNDSDENFKRRRIANAMVADMREMVRWARDGYDPRQMYADNRIDAISIDPYVLDSILGEPTPENLIDSVMFVERDSKHEEERRLETYASIDLALEGLTENEKTAFILRRAESITLTKIAEAMGITISSVSVYIRRAEKKIRANVAEMYGSRSALNETAS